MDSNHHPQDIITSHIRMDEFNERNIVYGFVNTQPTGRKPAFNYTKEFREGLKSCIQIVAYILDRYIHDEVSAFQCQTTITHI